MIADWQILQPQNAQPVEIEEAAAEDAEEEELLPGVAEEQPVPEDIGASAVAHREAENTNSEERGASSDSGQRGRPWLASDGEALQVLPTAACSLELKVLKFCLNS